MIRFALAGNPNCGKTTLFNNLTGSTAHVGNWPGVTVDKREGVYKKCSEPISIVDLPGIYSLSPYTPEEVISRKYILDEKPDCVINIVDATNLERNLYLTTQILEMDVPIVIALNMMDMLEKQGDKIDENELEKRLGVPVVKISALKSSGIHELMERAYAVSKIARKGKTVLEGCELSHLIGDVKIALEGQSIENPLFHAIKLVENDEIEVKMHPNTIKMVDDFKKTFDNELFGTDFEALVADARYKYISKNYSPLMTKKEKGVKLSKSDKVDRILTNKWFGIPIFLGILFAIFHLTFGEDLFYISAIAGGLPSLEELGITDGFGASLLACFYDGAIFTPGVILFNLMDLITSTLFGWITDLVAGLGASSWAVSLIGDGILGGLGGVLSFVPQIIVLLLFLSILEDTGYMARVAFILDRIFRKFGISGRAFIPMIMGFGCSIPAMINTRTLADERERTMTIRAIPFFTCGAKLPILTAIAGAIALQFGGAASIISFSMYVLGLVVAVVSIIVMRGTTQRGPIAPFIMELPAYHAPGFKSLMVHMWDKTKHYVKKVFTIILVSTIVIWVLSNFSFGWEFLIKDCVEYVKLNDGSLMLFAEYSQLYPELALESDVFLMHATEWIELGYAIPEGLEFVAANISMDQSILGGIGMMVQPLFTTMGFGSQLGSTGWVFAVAAVTGLIAKENVIATFGTLAACIAGLAVGTEEGIVEVQQMITATGIGWQGLIAFIVFNMTTIPCFAAVASAKGELGKGKTKWTILFWMIASILTATVVYTVLNWWWTAFIYAVVAAVVICLVRAYNKKHPTKA